MKDIEKLKLMAGWLKVNGLNNMGQDLADIANNLSSQLDLLVMPKAEFTPMVAHVVIKNKEAENKLEQILNGNEFYIDYSQSLTSYKAEQK